MFQTLRSKLTFSHVAIAALCLALVLVATLVLAGDVARRNGFDSLRQKKALVLPVVQLAIAGQRRPDPRPVFNRIRESIGKSGLRVLLVDPQTMEVQVDASLVHDAVGERFTMDDSATGFYQRLAAEGVEGTFAFADENATFQYVAQRVRFLQTRNAQTDRTANQPGALAPLILVLAQPQPTLREFVAQLGSYVLPAVALAVLVSLLAAYLLARSISKPISQLAHGAAAMSRGDYKQRLAVQGRDELASLTRQFNEMAEEVDRAHQMERDFIANVSHDLKTPLTSVQGFSQAMLDGTIKDEQAYLQAASIIHAEADRMSRLVNELLNLSRLQSGLVTMELRPTVLGQLLSQLALAMHPQASAAGIELSVVLADSGTIVMVDADRLRQALGNLLDNAVKYTPAGGRVSIETRDAPAGVEIRVVDTGRGIPAEELPRVMERFYQTDKARSAAEGKSVGLGLAIAREIILAHHGHLAIESEPAGGTTVRVMLPGAAGTVPSQARAGFLRRGSKQPDGTHPLTSPATPGAVPSREAGVERGSVQSG